MRAGAEEAHAHLYNQRPAWLDHIHEELDAAVVAAYGWLADLSDDEILARLFALNQARAGAGQVESRAARPIVVEPVG